MEHIRKMTDTLSKDGEEAKEQAHDVVESAWEKGRETWKDLSGQGKDAMVEAQKNAKKAWKESQRLLQEHPGKAVGIALVLGAAIGAFWAWRNTDSR